MHYKHYIDIQESSCKTLISKDFKKHNIHD